MQEIRGLDSDGCSIGFGLVYNVIRNYRDFESIYVKKAID